MYPKAEMSSMTDRISKTRIEDDDSEDSISIGIVSTMNGKTIVTHPANT